VLRLIRKWVKESPELSRAALSRKVCEQLHWRAENGRLQEMSCRVALVRLDERGVIELPAARNARGGLRKTDRWRAPPDAALYCTVAELGKIRLVAVNTPALSELWNLWIAGYHYVGFRPLVGRQKRYLIKSEKQGYLGALGFSASARRLGERDRWIGWDDATRARHLQKIVCNSRFLILPWVEVKNLASHVLALAARQVVRDWERAYGYAPVLLETCVDPRRFKGTCYRAANWIEVGKTAGRGRNDRSGKRCGEKHAIYLYPLRGGFREQLCQGMAPPAAAADWAEQELGRARLGDERLGRRLVDLGRCFYSNPQANLPQACGTRAQTKAAYRLLENRKVTMEEILTSHRRSTVERMREEEEVVLCAQDTTSLNYSTHHDTEGLGAIGTNSSGAQGLIVHDTLALSAQSGVALGVLDVQVWARDPKKLRGAGRAIEQKESAKWLKSYEAACRAKAELAEKVTVVSVGDREADVYELFALAHERKNGAHLLVRSMNTRRVTGDDHSLWEQLAAASVAGYQDVEISARPGRKARVAKLTIRFADVTLKAPPGRRGLGDIPIRIIEAQEEGAPRGTEPLHWRLLTTLKVNNLQDAARLLRWYGLRWQIEVYHRTLKTCCRIEDRQVATAERIENCLALDMVVAWRVLHLTRISRTQSDRPCTDFVEDYKWRALYLYLRARGDRTVKITDTAPTIREFTHRVAQLGGFLGRKSDGDPGTQTLARGIATFDVIVFTYEIVRETHAPP
jgi:hypothetical protein